jgi:hypothetical protein
MTDLFRALLLRSQRDDMQRFLGTICRAFFEVALDPAHLVGYRKAKHLSSVGENSRLQCRIDTYG